MVDVAWEMVVGNGFTWNREITVVYQNRTNAAWTRRLNESRTPSPARSHAEHGNEVFVSAHSTGLMTNPLSSFG